ncbi:MAG: nuclear transport factor 2 family protein [Solirubrobacterales bacterium]
MPDDAVKTVRESLDRFLAGDRRGAAATWAEDAIGVPPREWPESGVLEGREAILAMFESWDLAFGSDWPSKMTTERVTDLGEGRVLVELAFEPSGVQSGIPLDQSLSAIYTVREERIVEARFFVGRDEARASAGLELEE